jgi:prephenate dehydrogenase
MTTSTTKDPPPGPDAKLDAAAIEPPIARKIQPEPTVPTAAPEADLESRITQRRAELIATLGELKADLRLATTEVRDRMKARLSELAHIIKVGVVDGWTNLGDTVKHRLEHWLAESERAMQDLPARNGKPS